MNPAVLAERKWGESRMTSVIRHPAAHEEVWKEFYSNPIDGINRHVGASFHQALQVVTRLAVPAGVGWL